MKKGYVVKLVGPALIGRRAYVQFALLMKVGSSSRIEIRASNRRTRHSSIVTRFDPKYIMILLWGLPSELLEIPEGQAS